MNVKVKGKAIGFLQRHKKSVYIPKFLVRALDEPQVKVQNPIVSALQNKYSGQLITQLRPAQGGFLTSIFHVSDYVALLKLISGLR